MPAPPTAVNGSSSLLPTPTARDWKDSGDFTPHPEKAKLPHTIAMLPTPRAQLAEDRNNKLWRRPDGQPQNLENALARLIGAPTPTPSPDGDTPSGDPPLDPPTMSDD